MIEKDFFFLFFFLSNKSRKLEIRYSGVYVFQIVSGDLMYTYIYTLAGGVILSFACVFAPYGWPALA